MSCEIGIKLNFSYDGNEVTSAPSAHYEHRATSLGRVQNTPIAVGDMSRPVKVEALLGDKWTILSDFPFKAQFCGYSMVNLKGALFLFGKLILFTY